MSKSKKELKALVDEFRSQVKLAKQTPKKSEAKSEEWIRGQMKRVKGHKVARPKVGSMYMFGYVAKYKDTLPYWDMYPLIICLNFNATHMLGLNLHYIPPRAREVFLESMLKHVTTKTITNKSRMDISWNKVKRVPGAKHMIKMYLASHVRLGIKEVAPKDWHNVIHLKTQKFVSKGRAVSATRAYNDYWKNK